MYSISLVVAAEGSNSAVHASKEPCPRRGRRQQHADHHSTTITGARGYSTYKCSSLLYICNSHRIIIFLQKRKGRIYVYGEPIITLLFWFNFLVEIPQPKNMARLIICPKVGIRHK